MQEVFPTQPGFMLNIANCREIRPKVIDDGIDGLLTVAECSRQIPFDVKRVYTITGFGDQDAVRGKHAHKKLEQAIFCIHGSFEIDLDDGTNQKKIILNRPEIGLYLGPRLWHVMKFFSSDCVILVLASDVFNESDYIRDYDEFTRYVRTPGGSV